MAVNLTIKDLAFLGKYTKLDKKKIISLTEEESDLYAILDSFARQEFAKEELSSVSFKLIIPLIIFKLTKEKKYTFQEKSYMIDALCTFLPLIGGKKDIVLDDPRKSEETAKLNTVIYAFLDMDNNRLLFDIGSAFRLLERRELAEHLNDWLQIIKDMRVELWKTVAV